MTADLINTVIRPYIEALVFKDKVGGVVRPMTLVRVSDDGIKSKKIIPVDCGVTHRECISGKYTDLMPDSKYKSVIYFEDNGTQRVDDEHRDFSFQSNVKLVCWLNLKKLGKTNCSVSSLALGSILKAIPTQYLNSAPYTRILITFLGEDPKTPSIFGKYTYDEEKIPYLLYPYDYFSLNFSIRYTIPRSCITDFENDPEINCITND